MYLVHPVSQHVKISILKSSNAATSLSVSRELEFGSEMPLPHRLCFEYLGLNCWLYCKIFGNFGKKFRASLEGVSQQVLGVLFLASSCLSFAISCLTGDREFPQYTFLCVLLNSQNPVAKD